MAVNYTRSPVPPYAGAMMPRGVSSAKMIGDYIGAGEMLAKTLFEGLGLNSEAEKKARQLILEYPFLENPTPQQTQNYYQARAQFPDEDRLADKMMVDRAALLKIRGLAMDLESKKRRSDKDDLVNRALSEGNYGLAAAIDPVKTANYQTVMSNVDKVPLNKSKMALQFLDVGFGLLGRVAKANPKMPLSTFIRDHFKPFARSMPEQSRAAFAHLINEAIKDNETGEILTVGAFEKGIRKTATAADMLKMSQAQKEAALARKATAETRQAQDEYRIKGLNDALKELATREPTKENMARTRAIEAQLDQLLGVQGRRIGGGDPRLEAGSAETINRAAGATQATAGAPAPGPEAGPGPAPAGGPSPEEITGIHEIEDGHVPPSQLERAGAAVTGAVDRAVGAVRERLEGAREVETPTALQDQMAREQQLATETPTGGPAIAEAAATPPPAPEAPAPEAPAPEAPTTEEPEKVAGEAVKFGIGSSVVIGEKMYRVVGHNRKKRREIQQKLKKYAKYLEYRLEGGQIKVYDKGGLAFEQDGKHVTLEVF